MAPSYPGGGPFFRWPYIMRRSPPIAPHRPNQDSYIVLDDFGARLGRAWRETKEDAADRETLIQDLIAGEFSHPIRIIAFNTAEGWSRDVTADIADEVRRRFAERDDAIPFCSLQKLTGAECYFSDRL